MPYLDRPNFIRLLDQLGNTNDADALAAARDIDRRVKAADVTWDALLRPPPGQDHDDDAPAPAAMAALPPGEAADDTALIDQLLASHSLSSDTRDMLNDFKDDIRRGEFTTADRSYLRSLRDRLANARN